MNQEGRRFEINIHILKRMAKVPLNSALCSIMVLASTSLNNSCYLGGGGIPLGKLFECEIRSDLENVKP